MLEEGSFKKTLKIEKCMPEYRLTSRNSRITDNFIRKIVGNNLEITSYDLRACGLNSEIDSGVASIEEHFFETEKPLTKAQIDKLKKIF